MSSPYYYGTPKTATAVVSAANANRDGSGTLADLLTAGANGSMVIGAVIMATGATTPGMVRLFHNDGTDAADNKLVGEVEVTAGGGGSDPVYRGAWAPPFPLVIPPGGKLKASTHNGETFHLTTNYGDL